MNIGWPEGIIIAMMFLSLMIGAVKNGDPRIETTGARKGEPERYSFPVVLVRVSLMMVLLYLGGFFS